MLPVTPRWVSWKFENYWKWSRGVLSSWQNPLNHKNHRFRPLLRSKRSKLANFPVFSIVFYRKHSKIKRTVFRPCCTWFQGLIFCTEHCLSILEAWWEGQVGTLSFSLNPFSVYNSRVCASDRTTMIQSGVETYVFRTITEIWEVVVALSDA